VNIAEKLASLIPGHEPESPAGTIRVVDPSPLNWLSITRNTCEALFRVEADGHPAPAGTSSYTWIDNQTLEIRIREGDYFADGEAVTAAAVKRSIDEATKWRAPHPHGTHLNLPLAVPCEITGEHTVRLQLSGPDGFALGKLRALPIMSTRFWEELGFGNKRKGSAEGHWQVLDGPGAWGTGPFLLTMGYSSLDNEEAVICRRPFASTWLPLKEDRSSGVRLEANPNYGDIRRGPHVQEVLFRNDIPPDRALELVCDTEGEVDLVTEVPPDKASEVESSRYAKLVCIEAFRVVAGVINRTAEGLPLADRRARLALNLAIDRDRIVREAVYGKADPLGGLTPPAAVTFLHRLPPYPHQPVRAWDLWEEAGGGQSRALRITAPAKFETAAQIVVANIKDALGIQTELKIIRDPQDLRRAQRQLIEKERPLDWDIFIQEQRAQAADTVVLELHRALVGATGEFRAGPVSPGFELLYRERLAETSGVKIAHLAHRVDKFVFDEAYALFLYAPHVLYAVNKHVHFTPYRTTLDLAQTRVGDVHWSRRPRTAHA
jgi:ABC-type transport system substrate-binding protein